MDKPPPLPKTTSPSFSHQSAKVSWICPLLVVFLLMATKQIGARFIIELVAFLLFVVGFVFGIIALSGIRKHGKSGILTPAIVGIIINGSFLLIFITNFLGAKARAQQEANELTVFTPTASAGQDGHARQTYRTEGLTFDFDGAYTLKANKETGLIFLEHDDSHIQVASLQRLVDVTETLKLQATGLLQDFKSQSYGGITQSDLEEIQGVIRSGGVVRLGYERPGKVRIHADVYLLSDQTNCISVLHYYPDKNEATAKKLFQTLLLSLKDGK